MTMSTEEILEARQRSHGHFEIQAKLTQRLKCVMSCEDGNFVAMADDQREALEMIAGKIGRIISGDPNHSDHWEDIAGYARLIARRLSRVK